MELSYADSHTKAHPEMHIEFVQCKPWGPLRRQHRLIPCVFLLVEMTIEDVHTELRNNRYAVRI